MQITDADISIFIGTYMWPFLRISALFSVAPVLSSQTVSIRIRITLVLAITLLVTPLLPTVPAINIFSPDALLIAVQQVLIGTSMGFALQLVFSIFAMAGQILAFQMGLGFSMLVDPASGVQVAALGQFYVMLVTLLYLSLDGHLILLQVLVESFYSMPIAVNGLGNKGLWQLLSWAKVMYSSAILMVLPGIIALLMVNVSFGVMSRATPQMSPFSIGFPITILIGFFVIFMSIGEVVPFLKIALDDIFRVLREMYNIKSIP